jgi:hypothetical protein
LDVCGEGILSPAESVSNQQPASGPAKHLIGSRQLLHRKILELGYGLVTAKPALPDSVDTKRARRIIYTQISHRNINTVPRRVAILGNAGSVRKHPLLIVESAIEFKISARTEESCNGGGDNAVLMAENR